MIHDKYMKFKFLCPLIKFYWDLAISIICILSRAAFKIQRHSEVLATRVYCSQSQKYFLSGPLQKTFADPTSRLHFPASLTARWGHVAVKVKYQMCSLHAFFCL